MKELKRIIVIGLGSMGNRRLRLLRKLRLELYLCGVDMNVERRARVEENFGIRTYASVSQALGSETLEAAVICTSPLTHAAIISEPPRKRIPIILFECL